ncbi:MAG: YncE family protein [Schleiferiaceae bacterium]
MKYAFWAVAGWAALSSCDPATPNSPFESGLYVLNEGAFMGGTATITYWSAQDSLVHDAFAVANGRSLGNLGNSLISDGSRMYVVLNGAASVEVMDYPGLTSVGRATGFASPRHAVKLPNGDLAVTDWGRNRVYRVRSSDWTIADSVDVGQGPEAMVSHLDELWVSMSGAYGIDSALMVLDASTFQVLDTVYVGTNPTSMLRLGSMLYVLSSGYTDWSGGGGDRSASLSLVDLGTRTEIKRHPATNAADRPAKLQTDGQVLYWIRDGYTGDVLRMNPADHEYPAAPFISGSAYGIYADPATRNLYVLDAKDFQQPGEVRRYRPGGQLDASMPAGIVPTAALWMP